MATAARRKRRSTTAATPRTANNSHSNSSATDPAASVAFAAGAVSTVVAATEAASVSSSTDPHAREVPMVASASTSVNNSSNNRHNNSSSGTSLSADQHVDAAASPSGATGTLHLLTGPADSGQLAASANDSSANSASARASTKRVRAESESLRPSRSNTRMRHSGDLDNEPSDAPRSEAPAVDDAHAWTDSDALSHHDILARLAALSAKNQQLSADIELLKRNYMLRQAETNRLLVGFDTVNKVEREVADLQREYRTCARSNVALIQDALQRIAYCASQVDALSAGESVTASQLENFRVECSREMDDLLLKLEDVEAVQRNDQARADLRNVSALDEIRRNRNEIEQLKHEFGSFRRQSLAVDTGQVPVSHRSAHGMLPGLAHASDDGSESGGASGGPEHALVVRIERFSSQLEDMYNEMAMLKQFLLQESSTSRSSMEKLVMRHLQDFQDAQDDESKRLQDEMDELRSELCDVLKEMHLLKERTRYLRPDCTKRPKQQRRREQSGRASGNTGATTGAASGAHTPSAHSPDLCSTCSSFLSSGFGPHHGIDDRTQSTAPMNQQQQRTRCSRTHCDHPHQCRYHYPLSLETARADQRDYAFVHGASSASLLHSQQVPPQQQRPSPASSRSSSPRRPSDAVLQALQQHNASAAQQTAAATTTLAHQLHGAQSCPSPHFSSRSSSISGRLSVNRDEHGEPLREEEVERRLLEQHRLFWIKEGAGEPK